MLEARDITFGYGKQAPVLKGVSLSVASDERVAIVAPSGAGKTTLCRILAGYERPQAGTVLVDGAPLPEKGCCPVQMIGQHPEVFFDPRMTLAASLAEAGSSTGELLGRFDVREEWLTRYPGELSGGELQRLCIVRALAAEPRYLIADEMTVMLDAITQARIWHELLIEAVRRTMGLIIVSHSPALTARIATRVVEL